MKRPRLDVNLEELDQIIDRGTHAPLSESEGEKLKRVLHALAGMLPAPRTCGPELFKVTQPPSPSDIHDVGHRAQGSSQHRGPLAIDVDGH
jgi:hypothetical protein